ncbi:MAG: aminotransferase class I/II-fold pyridoxal phosphate-dependent enzyme [Chitinispirillales bacterium]|jgi:aspartate/methionine/tyrosine aminotransferase|nr:aminotransferase class I/II-fold pyridoxal phosphate-dependent enzyme [Chitinispirillales bacterium]
MIDPQALKLNEAIKAANPYVFDMLSTKGQRIFFPSQGILAQTAEAKGKALNATIGVAFEDCGALMILPSVGVQAVAGDKDSFSYAPNLGKPEIRNMWRKTILKKNPRLKEDGISNPITTSALTHGLSATGYLLVNPGDKIIIPDLYWENYNLVFNYAYGSEFETYPIFNANDGFNTDGLRQKLLEGPAGKRIVVLNFPNNPTGYTITVDEAKAVKEIIVEAAEKGNSVIVIVDDAYFGLVFEDGILRESIFSYLADAHERVLAVKIDGPTKEDYVWGIRVGFVTFGCARGDAAFYRAMESKLGGSIRGSTSSASNVGQSILLKAYESESYNRERAEKTEILQRRYKKIKRILDTRKEYGEYLRPLPFNSGYFMCLEVKNGKAEEIRKVLLDKYDTGVISLGNLLRVAFSSTPYEMLEKLFENIHKAAGEVR